MLENKYVILTSVTYQTNVTNIPNLLMGYSLFDMEFESNGYAEYCFTKYYDSPLLLICSINYNIEGTYLLKLENKIKMKLY